MRFVTVPGLYAGSGRYCVLGGGGGASAVRVLHTLCVVCVGGVSCYMTPSYPGSHGVLQAKYNFPPHPTPSDFSLPLTFPTCF